jgi:hypothetical protein
MQLDYRTHLAYHIARATMPYATTATSPPKRRVACQWCTAGTVFTPRRRIYTDSRGRRRSTTDLVPERCKHCKGTGWIPQ